MPHPSSRLPRPRLAVGAVVAVLAAACSMLVVPGPASAAVVHRSGFDGTVLGHRGWFGSYDLAGVGAAWCVDHGIAAPDPALDYRPAELGERAGDTRRAMAWVLGSVGTDADRVTAAAATLVLHELAGAVYPNGPLRVESLRATDLIGFGGSEGAVVERARALRAEAVDRSSLRPPLTLSVEAAPTPAGRPAEAVVRLADAGGRGVPGVAVAVGGSVAALPGGAGGMTDAEGRLRVPFTAGAGVNRIEARATVPDLALQSFAPTRRPAQRVARPARVDLVAEAGFGARHRGRLRVHKVGDATAWLPVGGATFEVRDSAGQPVATLTADVAGATPEVEVDAGRYSVVEIAPAPGYEAGGPWPAEVSADATVVVEAANSARRGGFRLIKRDAATGVPVAGARFGVAYDADADGTFETALDPVVSGIEPVVVEGLLPGGHRLTELEAPAGYERLATPVDVAVPPGVVAEVVVADVPLATLAFAKVPTGLFDPAALDLSGAVFAVTAPDQREVGRCTTDAAGRCALPPLSLRAGTEHCWVEVTAPPGWEAAAPGCATTGTAASTTTVEVQERSTRALVPARKVDAGTGAPLAGATYELRRREGGSGDGVLVGRATSGPDGALAWSPQLPGSVYCAREVEAPPGYVLDTTLRCLDRPLATGASPAVLVLEDVAVPVPVVAAALPVRPVPVATATATVPRPTTTSTTTVAVQVRTPPTNTPPTSTLPTNTPAPDRPQLPRTGAPLRSLALLGLGLVLGGASLVPSRRS